MVATAAAMDSQTYFFSDGAALKSAMLHEGAQVVEHPHAPLEGDSPSSAAPSVPGCRSESSELLVRPTARP